MSEDLHEASVPWCDACHDYHRSETHGACDHVDYLRRLGFEFGTVRARVNNRAWFLVFWVLLRTARGLFWGAHYLQVLAAYLYALAGRLSS